MSHSVETDVDQAATDTVTIAGLMNAVHTLHGELLRCPQTRQRLAAIESGVVRSIKQIDAGAFDYETQAAGLGECLRLVKTMFRYSHATEGQVSAA